MDGVDQPVCADVTRAVLRDKWNTANKTERSIHTADTPRDVSKRVQPKASRPMLAAMWLAEGQGRIRTMGIGSIVRS